MTVWMFLRAYGLTEFSDKPVLKAFDGRKTTKKIFLKTLLKLWKMAKERTILLQL